MADASALEVGPAASGTAVRLARGTELMLVLPENPTTGYRWTVVQCDPALAPGGASFEAPAPGAAGAGGVRRLRFVSVADGHARLRLLLKQPWLDDASADASFEIDVTVEP